jgi:uncharacterized protein (TIGR00369 family)
VQKQPNSRYCFLCGIENPKGLRLAFYEDAEDHVLVRFVPEEPYQGYPGRLHGGIICALLDETIGRTLVQRDLWAVTAELNVRFRRPVPLGEPITVIGEIARLRSRTMEGVGELCLADGTVAATAEAKYVLLSEEQVKRYKEELGYWQIVPDTETRGSGPQELEG